MATTVQPQAGQPVYLPPGTAQPTVVMQPPAAAPGTVMYYPPGTAGVPQGVVLMVSVVTTPPPPHIHTLAHTRIDKDLHDQSVFYLSIAYDWI